MIFKLRCFHFFPRGEAAIDRQGVSIAVYTESAVLLEIVPGSDDSGGGGKIFLKEKAKGDSPC